MVMCDCYKPDGTPIDGNTRLACNEVMEKVSRGVYGTGPAKPFEPASIFLSVYVGNSLINAGMPEMLLMATSIPLYFALR